MRTDSPTTLVGTTGGQLGSVGEVEIAASGTEQIVVPLVEEVLSVGKREVERGGVRITKTVEARDEQVPISLRREAVSVERVPIGQYVDTPPAPRQEGDTLIVPVFEEVVIKRILLKEELRITRTTTTVEETQTVTLRREHVQVERLSPDGADSSDSAR